MNSAFARAVGVSLSAKALMPGTEPDIDHSRGVGRVAGLAQPWTGTCWMPRAEKRDVTFELHDLFPALDRKVFQPLHPKLVPALLTRMSRCWVVWACKSA